jgi:inosine-uridine nucleoside N-ribohydrolase
MGWNTAVGQKQKVWLDADTGNETDDVYAIVQLLTDPSIEVVGLSSAHFNNADLVAFEKWNQYDTKAINTVRISQQLNVEILRLMGKTAIPHPLGADRQMGRAWGGQEARRSAAADQLISVVKKLGPGEKLHVLCLGALTNIASAMVMDTAIASRIQCYLLGAQYNADKKAWNKSEFNIRNDLNAFDYLLNNPKAELIVMPTSTAASFRFKRDSLYTILTDKNPVLTNLKRRWEETNPQSTERTLWDVALVLAYQKPELTTSQQVMTPPENTQRLIRVYTQLDVTMRPYYLEQLRRMKQSK